MTGHRAEAWEYMTDQQRWWEALRPEGAGELNSVLELQGKPGVPGCAHSPGAERVRCKVQQLCRRGRQMHSSGGRSLRQL